MSSMPLPQADTPTDMAVADVDTYIRLGIEGQSVRTPPPTVKSRKGDRVSSSHERVTV